MVGAGGETGGAAGPDAGWDEPGAGDDEDAGGGADGGGDPPAGRLDTGAGAGAAVAAAGGATGTKTIVAPVAPGTAVTPGGTGEPGGTPGADVSALMTRPAGGAMSLTSIPMWKRDATEPGACVTGDLKLAPDTNGDCSNSSIIFPATPVSP